MSEIDLKISELSDSPWRFRVISSKDYNNLVNTITIYGPQTIGSILVAKIEGRFYIVDGHARRDAMIEAGFDKIRCVIADWVRNFNDLRVWSFKLNRHGHYNPIHLLNMVKEDVKVFGIEEVAANYGVSNEYIDNLLKLDALDNNAKVLVDKVINLARKRYQFVLEQINAHHLSIIAELEPKKQLEVLHWIFHDIIYGPPNESLVSLPSIYEIINLVESNKERNTNLQYATRKYRSKALVPKIDHLEFSCSCGKRFHVDLSLAKAYEYVETDNLVIKREVESEVLNEHLATKNPNDK